MLEILDDVAGVRRVDDLATSDLHPGVRAGEEDVVGPGRTCSPWLPVVLAGRVLSMIVISRSCASSIQEARSRISLCCAR
jgi:hypothetical protein